MAPPRMSNSFITTPAPAAREMAVRMASISRATPDSMSPDRKSRIELVSATPGTNSMMALMMMGS